MSHHQRGPTVFGECQGNPVVMISSLHRSTKALDQSRLLICLNTSFLTCVFTQSIFFICVLFIFYSVLWFYLCFFLSMNQSYIIFIFFDYLPFSFHLCFYSYLFPCDVNGFFGSFLSGLSKTVPKAHPPTLPHI